MGPQIAQPPDAEVESTVAFNSEPKTCRHTLTWDVRRPDRNGLYSRKGFWFIVVRVQRQMGSARMPKKAADMTLLRSGLKLGLAQSRRL